MLLNLKQASSKAIFVNKSEIGTRKNRFTLGIWYLLQVLVVIIAQWPFLFGYGDGAYSFNWAFDAARYQCYAVAFWKGLPGLGLLPGNQCSFLSANSISRINLPLAWQQSQTFIGHLVSLQNPSYPFHVLPSEYPVLSIIPFSIGLLAPLRWYQVTFGLFMIAIAVVIYYLLHRYRSKGAAMMFMIYVILGSWATAEARYDLLPAGLTLAAVILAERSRWKLSAVLLALATMLKFYPVALLPIIFIAIVRENGIRNGIKRIYQVFGVFTLVCTALMAVSLSLSFADTIGPISYFGSRPIQIESFAAAFVSIGTFFGAPVHYVYSFGSINIVSSISSTVSFLFTAATFLGLLYTFYLQMRGKIDLAVSCLIALLIILLTGKVLSPQYILWVAPLIAYVGQANWKWVVSWSLVAAITTLIYPFVYFYSYPNDLNMPDTPLFYPLVTVRGLLILAIVAALLYQAHRSYANSTKMYNLKLNVVAGLKHT